MIRRVSRAEVAARIAREKAIKNASPDDSPQADRCPNPPATQGAPMTKCRRRRTGGSEPYEVGYAKPPKTSQFRKGESGNKSGRPKGSKNITTLLMEALSEEVVVTENGRPRRISKLQLGVDQFVNQFAGGDLRAAAMTFKRLDADENRIDSEPTDGLDEADREVAQTLTNRLGKAPKEEQ